SRATRLWQAALVLASALVVLQIVSAMLRGGKLRQFLWPRPLVMLRLLLAGNPYTRLRDATWELLGSLRLPHYFALGLRGFVGAAAWIALPISMLAGAARLGARGSPILGLAGGALLVLVLLHLPFLQARMAEENRLKAVFELGAVRRRFT